MSTLTVLGANGFVGTRLCEVALAAGHNVRAVARSDWDAPTGVEKLVAPDPAASPDIFRGSAWAVNCIGRAHVLEAEEPEVAARRFNAVNCELAVALARQARAAGISRYVQISSVAAITSTTAPGEVVDDDTPPAPDRAYGVSKLAADRALLADARDAMTIACLRPPALIGPHPTGFVRKFARAADKGLPLPIGGIDGARSFVAVHNLADAILTALGQGLHGAYIVTDSPPMRVGELYREMLRAAGYGNRSLRVPGKLVEMVAGLALGPRKDSLLGSAAYDGDRFARETGWRPPVAMAAALDEMMATL